MRIPPPKEKNRKNSLYPQIFKNAFVTSEFTLVKRLRVVSSVMMPIGVCISTCRILTLTVCQIGINLTIYSFTVEENFGICVCETSHICLILPFIPSILEFVLVELPRFGIKYSLFHHG